MENKIEKSVVSNDKAVPDNLPVGTEKPSEQAPTASQEQSMNDFIRNEENRRTAYAHALNLWKIVTKNSPIENSSSIVISETEVCRKTTLSHSKARKLFDVLRAFGYLRNIDKLNFNLIFNPEEQRRVVEIEATALAVSLSDEINRYKAILEYDTSLNKVERKNEYEIFKKNLLDSILF